MRLVQSFICKDASLYSKKNVIESFKAYFGVCFPPRLQWSVCDKLPLQCDNHC